jgi:hypothetical protein
MEGKLPPVRSCGERNNAPKLIGIRQAIDQGQIPPTRMSHHDRVLDIHLLQCSVDQTNLLERPCAFVLVLTVPESGTIESDHPVILGQAIEVRHGPIVEGTAISMEQDDGLALALAEIMEPEPLDGDEVPLRWIARLGPADDCIRAKFTAKQDKA